MKSQADLEKSHARLLAACSEALGSIEGILKVNPRMAYGVYGSTTLGNHRVELKGAIKEARGLKS